MGVVKYAVTSNADGSTSIDYDVWTPDTLVRKTDVNIWTSFVSGKALSNGSSSSSSLTSRFSQALLTASLTTTTLPCGTFSVAPLPSTAHSLHLLAPVNLSSLESQPPLPLSALLLPLPLPLVYAFVVVVSAIIITFWKYKY